MKTQVIAGHEITLEAGTRYVASRPLNRRGVTEYPVTIRSLDGAYWWDNAPVLVIKGLDFKEAAALVDVFNYWPISTSFMERVW